MSKRTFALILAVMMFIPLLLCSCAGNGNDTETTTAAAGESTAAETEKTEPDDGWTEIYDDLPKDLRYEGTEFVMLIRDTSPYKEEFVAVEDGTILDAAVSKRNYEVEERFGITLTFDQRFGDYSKYKEFNSLVNKSVQAGDKSWDAVAAFAAGTIPETVNGTYLNLLDCSEINLEKAYWNKSATEQFTIHGKLYNITGSISPQLIGQSIVFFENLKLAKDYNVEDIYTLVNEKKWTHEKLLSIITDVYSDANGNNSRDKDDVFGLTCPLNSQVDAFHASYDVPLNTIDADGELKYAFEQEKVIGLYDKVYELLVTCSGTWAAKDYADDYGTDYLRHFADDKALFTINRLHTVSTSLTEMSSDFAILPYPMASEDQGEYITYAWNQYSMISIPREVNDKNMSAAVIEAMASSSYNNVTPSYYELALKQRYSRDAESSQMVDLITSNIRIEYLFLEPSSSVIFFIRDNIKTKTKSISAIYKGTNSSASKAFDKLMESYK